MDENILQNLINALIPISIIVFAFIIGFILRERETVIYVFTYAPRK